MNLFRIKNNYMAANQETGEVQKVKEEYLVSAVNYTDAESFIVNFNEKSGNNKFAPAEYEITKEKFNWNDIYMNDVFDHEEGALTCGLVELFFNDETDRLFSITARFFLDNEEKKKTCNKTFYIPAHSLEEAVKCLKNEIVENGDEYMITKTSADNMVSLFLTPDIVENGL